MKIAYAWLLTGVGLAFALAAGAQNVNTSPIKPKLKLAPLTLALTYNAQLKNRDYSGEVRARDANWRCAKGNCTTQTRWPEPTVAACAALARVAGTLTGFGAGKKMLAGNQLAECNRSAQKTLTAQAAVKPAIQQPLKTPPAASPGVQQTPTAPVIVNSNAQKTLKTAAAPNANIQPAQLRLKQKHFQDLLKQRQQAESVAKRGTPSTSSRRIASQGDDCDDNRRFIHRLAAEVCDGYDNNCNGVIDEGQQLTFFLDADGDGHGNPAQRIDACPADQQRAAREGRWLVPVGNDCDDTDPSRWQGCP